MWKNILERCRLQITIWRMRFVSWISKAINTNKGCVIFISFPPQKWLQERASVFTLYVLVHHMYGIRGSVLALPIYYFR